MPSSNQAAAIMFTGVPSMPCSHVVFQGGTMGRTTVRQVQSTLRSPAVSMSVSVDQSCATANTGWFSWEGVCLVLHHACGLLICTEQTYRN